MKKNLDQQIAELTAKHNLQQSVENSLPGIAKIYTNEFNYGAKGTKYTFTVYLDEIPLNEIRAKILQVIAAFPPSNNNCLTFAGKDNQQTASPFLLRFQNNIREVKTEIDYISGDYWIHIQTPVSYYSDDCKGVFMRKVYDSEFHYFPGVSGTRIRNMQIRAYRLDMFEKCSYYGGDVVNFIEHDDDKTEFESVVINGHTPEFSEFWQNQLKNL